MQYNNRPHPYVNTGAIPPGARRPANPSPAEAYAPYAFELSPPGDTWDYEASAPYTARPSYYGNGNGLDIPPRPRSRTRSVFEPPTEYLAFPEPQIYRSSSQRVSPTSHRPIHRSSKSDTGPVDMRDLSVSPTRGASPASSYYPNDDVCICIILDCTFIQPSC